MKTKPNFLSRNAIAVSLLLYSFAGPALANESGWILTQHSKLFGDQYLYLNSRGVKCINPKQGIGWVTETPSWNITFVNERTKLYYTLSAANWKRKIGQNGIAPTNINWSKIRSGSVAGLPASEYQMTNSPSQSAHSGSKWVSATYWLADSITVPASLSQLISAASGLPASNSIPLRLSYRNPKGQSEVLLDTYQQQKAAIPDSYFSVPTNYKTAKSEVEVLMSEENRSLLNDLAEDFSHGGTRTSASGQANELPLDKLPNQLTLPGGKTVSKDQINKFLNNFKQNR